MPTVVLKIKKILRMTAPEENNLEAGFTHSFNVSIPPPKKLKEERITADAEISIVKLVDSLIGKAVCQGASDIHVEPLNNMVRIRMRIDGMLHDVMCSPGETLPLIVSRIKIMANLDIAEKRLPQDGRINLQVALKDVNLRVSTLPTIRGEKVVIRILEKDKIILPLENLGFSPGNFTLFQDFMRQTAGMILITGPTGCGKTTTLYSALHYLNHPRVNIVSVEDPVEYHLEGINQVQVNQRIGMSFAGALRGILRQDPNIIMVGEIRDPETTEIAIRAALTGHLVMSTLHTNSAAGAITRLAHMGVARYLISSSLVGVVAQRLIRLVCPQCRQEYMLSLQEKKLFRKIFSRIPPASLVRGAGCKDCNHTGYRGRTALHEMIVMNRQIRRLVIKGASAEILQDRASRNGMITLIEDGLSHVERGGTTLEEVMRVIFNSAAMGDEMNSLDHVPATYSG